MLSDVGRLLLKHSLPVRIPQAVPSGQNFLLSPFLRDALAPITLCSYFVFVVRGPLNI